MNKILNSIISFCLKNKGFTFFLTGLLIVWGVISYVNTPVEAFPDVTNTQIIIVTEYAGASAEEVERLVSLPIEIAMAPVSRKTSVRSITMFGLSVTKIIFEDDVEDFLARQQVNNALRTVRFPEGVEPDVQPPYGPTGEIFRYVLKSNRDTRELLTWQNWVIDRKLRIVPGVADVVAFGGQEKIYEVSIEPDKLAQYNISVSKLMQAIAGSNKNVGGDVIEKNGQAYVVQSVGLLKTINDINNIVVDNVNGNPVYIKNVAAVNIGSAPRVGQVGLNKNNDVVEGIIVMRKGENPAEVLKRVKEKIAEINEKVLPKDIRMETFYDRDKLMSYCTHTVMHNLVEGIIFVTLVVLLFMADWRTTVIVSIIIPLALLFAFICLRLKGMSANLLSLGAVDFGIIIDGAVVMVEGLFVALDHKAHKLGMEKFNNLSKLGLVRSTGIEMGKAVFFSKLIIITALIPIFSFQKVEGKMFSPLAYTLGFALIGALFFTLTLVPVLSSILLKKNVREKKNIIVNFFHRITMSAFNWTYGHRTKTIIGAAIICGGILYSASFLGTEFLPQLNEGALWVEAKMPMSMSLKKTVEMVEVIRNKLMKFAEVNGVLSQSGRSNDGTDPSGFYYVQCQVNLKPKEEWKRKITIDQLIEEMNKELTQLQGIGYNYSQPIIDNVAEAVAGMNANNAVKIFGDDLHVLDSFANLTLTQIKDVRGIKDIGILRNTGQPGILIHWDSLKLALYGVDKAEAQSTVELAIGGTTATQLFEGEKRFDIRLRYTQDFRKSEDDIRKLMIPTMKGNKIPLDQLATVEDQNGAAFIYRDKGKRFIGVKFTVRERDLGGTIGEAQANVRKNIKLPLGYEYNWTGEFENQVRATQRLGQVVPLSLIAIFMILFITFGNAKDAGLVLLNVPFALIGGILALHITGTNFGISAGVGFIALFGLCVQNGVILISVFKKNLKDKLSLDDSIKLGIASRVRPIVMTAMMAMIGLIPAAVSTGIGSESQKPLAIVIIGGLISATTLTLLVFPVLSRWFYRKYR